MASLGTKDKILNRDHRAARLLRSNGERIRGQNYASARVMKVFEIIGFIGAALMVATLAMQ